MKAPEGIDNEHRVVSNRRVFSNSMSGAILLLVQIAAAFVMSPILIRELGNRDYGIWELMLGFVGYMGLLDVGIQPALVRYVANAHAVRDDQQMARLLSTGFAMLVATGVLGAVAVAMLSLAGVGDDVLNLSSTPNWLPAAFLVMGLLFLASFVMSAFSAYLLGLQHHATVNVVRCATTLAQATGVYIGLTQMNVPGLLWMASIHLVVAIFEALTFRALLYRLRPDLRVHYRDVRRDVAGNLIRFGLKNSIIMAAADLLRRAIPFIIAHTMTVAVVPFFALPGRLLEYSRGLVVALGYPLTAHFAGLAAFANDTLMREKWIATTRLLQMPAVILAIGMAGLGPQFLGWWIGAEFERRGESVLFWLSFALLAEGLACNATRILQGYNTHGKAALLSAILSPLALAAAVPVSDRWGLAGAAAIIAGFMLLKALGDLYFSTRQIGMRLAEHLWLSLRWNVLPALAACGALSFTAPSSGSVGILSIVGSAVATAIAFLVTWLFTSFSMAERSAALRVALRWRSAQS